MPLLRRQTLRPINRLAVIRCEFGPNGATRWYDPVNHANPFPMQVGEIWWIRPPTNTWSVEFHPWVNSNGSHENTGVSNYRVKALFTDGTDQNLDEFWYSECPIVRDSVDAFWTNYNGSFNNLGLGDWSCPIYDVDKQTKLAGLQIEYAAGCGAQGQLLEMPWMFILFNP